MPSRGRKFSHMYNIHRDRHRDILAMRKTHEFIKEQCDPNFVLAVWLRRHTYICYWIIFFYPHTGWINRKPIILTYEMLARIEFNDAKKISTFIKL